MFSAVKSKLADTVRILNPLECKGVYSATSNNMKVGTLAVDGWAAKCGTARRGLGGLRPNGRSPRTPRLAVYQM